jgi:putative serine protease PepD
VSQQPYWEVDQRQAPDERGAPWGGPPHEMENELGTNPQSPYNPQQPYGQQPYGQRPQGYQPYGAPQTTPMAPYSPPPPRKPPVAKLTAGVLAALMLVAGGFGLAQTLDDDPAATPTVQSGPAGPVPVDVQEPVAAVADALLPSVVQLETDRGLGSGVVYKKGGLILTAAHVVEGVVDVVVRLSDGRRVNGTVLGADPDTDIAVIDAEADDLEVATLATDVPLDVGQMAIAIGSPFGLDSSVTSGIVSAVGRTLETEGGRAVSTVQTDAPINPGNSGGALADRTGRVIGINDAILSDGGDNAGIGFAIPIDTALRVAESLEKGEDPVIGFLGVQLIDISGGQPGALVSDVTEGSGAEAAGLQADDLITRFNGQPIESSADLIAKVTATAPGTEVTIEIVRQGQVKEVDVTVGEAPDSP